MGVRKIVWSRRATANYVRILQWYQEERGQQFALSFFRGILETIDTLSQKPTISTLDERRTTQKTQYYSFLSHPKYRIIYRFTKSTLYMVAIHVTLMRQD